MPGAPIDLSGLKITAEDFVTAVMDTVAQPICVIDAKDLIRYANPAAVAALGYDGVGELIGRPGHETIHHRRRDGAPYPALECPVLLPRTTGETAARELDWFVRRDGSLLPVSYVSAPLELPDGRGVVVTFTDIENRLRAEHELRERDAALAAQQESLRRLAALVAGGAASAEVFTAIAREVAWLLELPLVELLRYEPDGAVAVIGMSSEGPHPFGPGTRWPIEGSSATARIKRTGRPARIDDYAGVPGTIGGAMRASGVRSGAAAPIVVDGEVWGAMAALSWDAPLPDRTEDRLADFAALISAVFSNTASRDELARLADEQAALRRVATLVAHEASPEDVFAAVAEELGRLLDAPATWLVRFEPNGEAEIVAAWGRYTRLPRGTRFTLGGLNVASEVARTGRPARIDDSSVATGALGALLDMHELRPGGAVGGPIVVAGRVWGAMGASSHGDKPLPPGTEASIEEFAALAASAISNAQARSDLAASRARIVAAADEERRRVVRDLHDGAQQRLVHTIITLKLANRALGRWDDRVAALLAEALEHAQRANVELRELAHGILPEDLTRGGLRAGVRALALSATVPVEIDVPWVRLPRDVEATAYFVAAESLTNVAKHARARRAWVTARVADGALRLEVRDDGTGGARLDGSGFIGLADRLAVLDGRMRVESPPGGGTVVVAEIPLDGARPAS